MSRQKILILWWGSSVWKSSKWNAQTHNVVCKTQTTEKEKFDYFSIINFVVKKNSTGMNSTLLSKIVYNHICLISVSFFFLNSVCFRFYCFVSLVWKLKRFEIFFFPPFLELMLLRSDILHTRKEPRALSMKGKTRFGIHRQLCAARKPTHTHTHITDMLTRGILR